MLQHLLLLLCTAQAAYQILIHTQYDGLHYGDIQFLHYMSCDACLYTYFKEKCYVMNITICLLWTVMTIQEWFHMVLILCI
jgi:hypothetical protein